MRTYNNPAFVHICKLMYTSGDLMNRDEYGNASPDWVDCDEYVNVNIVRLIKFIIFDGVERVSLSVEGRGNMCFMSDSIKYFRYLIEDTEEEE